jgi:hypothetical protein
MADGAHHILADAKGGDGVVAQEDGAVFPGGVEPILQSRVTERERLVTREGMLRRGHTHPRSCSSGRDFGWERTVGAQVYTAALIGSNTFLFFEGDFFSGRGK